MIVRRWIPAELTKVEFDKLDKKYYKLTHLDTGEISKPDNYRINNEMEWIQSYMNNHLFLKEIDEDGNERIIVNKLA